MRSRMVIVAAVVAIVAGGVIMVPSAMAKFGSKDQADSATWVSHHSTAAPLAGRAPSPSPRPPAPATLKARPVSVAVDGFFSWALMDRTTAKIAGAKNITSTNSTESMIKPWIVADYLRTTAASGKTPSRTRLKQASLAIRDSDDNAAESLYRAGGGNAVIQRMIRICRLTDTKVYPGWWSRTQISARDAVRMGNCIADGRAAGPKWTAWVLTEMTKVRGTTAAKDQHATTGGGRWGIIDGLPKEIIQQGVSIKNGWTAIGADGNWHVNCLAIGHDWVLAVLMRYPIAKGLKYGANVCASVARQLVVPGGTASQ